MPKHNPKYVITDTRREVGGGDISPMVAVQPVPHITNKFYNISFAHYKKNKCEIKELDKSGHLRKMLTWFRDVGLSTAQDELPASEHIKNLGNYSFLFDGLDEDVEVKEFKAGGTCRIFYFIDDGSKVVNILLIKNAHLEY